MDSGTKFVTGPPLPTANYGMSLITDAKQTTLLLLGGMFNSKAILRLVTNPGGVSKWKWVKEDAELPVGRSNFVAMNIPADLAQCA